MPTLVKLKAVALVDALMDTVAENAKTLIDTQVQLKAQGLYDALPNTLGDVKAETLAKVKAEWEMDDNLADEEIDKQDKTLTDMKSKTLIGVLADTLAEENA